MGRAEVAYLNMNSRISVQQQQLDNLESTIVQKQDTIKSMDKLVEDKKEQLTKDYAAKKAEIESSYLDYIDKCDTRKNEANLELSKIKNSILALNEALVRADQMQAEKEKYTLALTDSEKEDIKMLMNIKPQFSNPRVIGKLIWQSYYQPQAKVKFIKILGKANVCGIYKITNLKNNKCYIGQAVDVYKRWNQHSQKAVGIDTPFNNKLYKAMLEDGLYNFSFELLEECPREQLNEKEKFYIDTYQSVLVGYNSQAGNNG